MIRDPPMRQIFVKNTNIEKYLKSKKIDLFS